jgi:hypothetical protein
MHVRFPRMLPALLLVGVSSAFAAGCADDTDEPLTGPTTTVVETMRFVAVEPATVRPDFLPSQGCSGRPPFDVRFSLVLHAGTDSRLRRVGFEFVDGGGARVIPLILPTTSPASPVPIPTALNMVPLPLPAGIPSQLPFALRFPCGLRSPGTLIVIVDTTDAGGAGRTSRVTVSVSE